MQLPLVVLTFPGHFLLTALTIQSYLKYNPDTQRIVVLVDNLSPCAWPTYVSDCENLYSRFGVTIIPVDTCAVLGAFTHHAWVRQQVVKLYLDHYHDFDAWFYSDGDIIFLDTVEADTVPYSTPHVGELTRQQNRWVSHMLGIDMPGIVKNDRQVCVSNPAFRFMNTQCLNELREFIEQKHTSSFHAVLESFQHTDSWGVSEWELLENFKHHVLKQDLKLIKYEPLDYRVQVKPDSSRKQIVTGYCTDFALGKSWFEYQDLQITDKIWTNVQNIREYSYT